MLERGVVLHFFEDIVSSQCRRPLVGQLALEGLRRVPYLGKDDLEHRVLSDVVVVAVRRARADELRHVGVVGGEQLLFYERIDALARAAFDEWYALGVGEAVDIRETVGVGLLSEFCVHGVERRVDILLSLLHALVEHGVVADEVGRPAVIDLLLLCLLFLAELLYDCARERRPEMEGELVRMMDRFQRIVGGCEDLVQSLLQRNVPIWKHRAQLAVHVTGVSLVAQIVADLLKRQGGEGVPDHSEG